MPRHPHSQIGFFTSAPNVITLAVVTLIGIGLTGLTGCKNNEVGRSCFITAGQGDGGVEQTVVGAPAIECESSICLHVAEEPGNQCTARCSSDADCETSPESSCTRGFTCAIPVVTGTFCCERLCICRDFVGGDAGTLADPAGCVASNPANECCNLEGRSGNATYPLCK